MRDLSCTVHVPKLTVWNEMLYIKAEEGREKWEYGNDCACVCVLFTALSIAGEFQCRSGIWFSEDQGFKCLLHSGWGPGVKECTSFRVQLVD